MAFGTVAIKKSSRQRRQGCELLPAATAAWETLTEMCPMDNFGISLPKLQVPWTMQNLPSTKLASEFPSHEHLCCTQTLWAQLARETRHLTFST